MGEHETKAAGIMLGDRRRDIYLSDETRVAIVENFRVYPEAVWMEPDTFCGMVKVQDEYGCIDVGDGWRVSGEIVDLVESEHGYLTWAASKAMIEATNRQAGAVKCPVCWAWDKDNRLVAIVAPMMRDEPAAMAN